MGCGRPLSPYGVVISGSKVPLASLRSCNEVKVINVVGKEGIGSREEDRQVEHCEFNVLCVAGVNDEVA